MLNTPRSLSRRQKISIMVALDAACLPLLFYMALCLRGGALVAPDKAVLGAGLLVSIACLIALGFSGLYLSVIRFLDARILMRAASGLLAVLVFSHAAFSIAVPELQLAALWIFGSLAFSYVAITRFLARTLL